jgi:hypothetical protein
VAKRAIALFDQADLKSIFTDDAAWPQVEQALSDLVDPGCRFRWLALGEAGVEEQGYDGFRDGWLDWLEPWSEYRSRIEDYMDLEDGRVLVLARQTGRSADGTEIDMHAAAICEIRDGRLVSVDFHANREDALAEARRHA